MERRISNSSSSSISNSSLSSSSISVPSKDDCSLYANLYQCLLALRRLQSSCRTVHPLIQTLVRQLDEKIAFCLPVCSGDAKKLYAYIFDILDQLSNACDNRLVLYFNRSPYWQHYFMNMTEIVATLAACCRGRTKNGHSSVEFRRKFVPMSDVMRRRMNSVSGSVPWRKRSISSTTEL